MVSTMSTWIRYGLVMLLLAAPTALQAGNFTLDYDKSRVGFAGTHAGEPFDGVFKRWEGDISFHPDAPETSEFSVSFETGSAHTGNVMYDGTLPKGDWFDSKTHSKAIFRSTSVRKLEENRYEVTGDLSIRDITHPVTFSFDYMPAGQDSGGRSHALASFTIKRLDYEIGKGSDSEAEWVSDAITITLDLQATLENE